MRQYQYKTLDDYDFRDKVVLVRLDLNVPIKDGKVLSDLRVQRAVPTLKELHHKGAKTVILSHLGNPRGRVDESKSLKQVRPTLERHLGREVAWVDDCLGDAVRQTIAQLPRGGYVLLENVRFHPGEQANDRGFAEQLAALGDHYINDAFSTAHRAHASTLQLARLLPSCAGRFLAQELSTLQQELEQPRRPLAALVGGAKVETKLKLLRSLVQRVDVLIIGGAMANPFLASRNSHIKSGLAGDAEAGIMKAVAEIFAVAADSNHSIVLPYDVVAARDINGGDHARTITVDALPDDMCGFDIGPVSCETFAGHLSGCRSVVWNGPLGAFEHPPFAAGTTTIAHHVARLTRAKRLFSIVGGGDTIAAIGQTEEVLDQFSYVSTAGGAFLAWLEGSPLPALTALT